MAGKNIRLGNGEWVHQQPKNQRKFPEAQALSWKKLWNLPPAKRSCTILGRLGGGVTRTSVISEKGSGLMREASGLQQKTHLFEESLETSRV